MTLDFVTEADEKFFADNLLSLDDWGADVKHLGNLTGEELLKEIPDIQIPNLVDDCSPFYDTGSNDAFSTGTDFSGEPWESPNYSDDLINGVMIKNEPLSPSSSSCSDLSSDLPSFNLQSTEFEAFSKPFDMGLDSPPMTPPREDQCISPLSTTSLITATTTTVPNSVTVLSKPVTSRPPILPKLEPGVPTRNGVIQITQPQTITVKQVPVTVSSQSIIVSQGNAVNALPQNVNVVNYQPPVKQSKLCTGSNGVSVPLTTVPPNNVDLKAWKRQQRMIKNRESACLSRRKKKEYLQGLEGQLHESESQNEKLRTENELLRKRILALQSENEKLRKSQSPLAQTNKKAACLLAVLFFMAVNIAPFSLLSSSIENTSEYLTSSQHGRALLSFDDDVVHNILVKNNTVIGDIIRFIPELTNDNGSYFDIDRKDLMVLKDQPSLGVTNKLELCPMFNTTDTSRLVDELTGWVHGHEAKQQEKLQQDKKDEIRGKLFKKRQKSKPVKSQSRLSNPPLPEPDRYVDETSLQVFDSLFERTYTNFLEALNRRDDTFYVVSFRKDHLLLPATAHNSTRRPKMTLIVPAIGMNDTVLKTPHQHFSMMQIDCEVMNTRVVHVKNGDETTAFHDVNIEERHNNHTDSMLTQKGAKLQRDRPRNKSP
ncbi:cyclic AMP-dependent transcription factor ATF-6 alpha-like [Saccoglossus kowalevskii]|uniref:Cyclic AMP-dependent transcription factor ATF-6 alpha-like n=1 Tax=Saccoglossus kowalevskii TaxID=10224 RepID=A0ABM0GKM2_SACKO|nr:PREDICTED: cyclic AMP-dependent transcription factor ATF-6 alpha-like [Saccoglossus kowalevskii]